MKRKAFHSLEREKFLKGIDCFNDPHASRESINSSLTSDTPEQIAQRRVVRLKLPSEILAARMEAIEKKTSSLTMEAPETVTQAQTTQNILPPPSFFNRPMIPVPAGQTEETSKVTVETQTSSSDQNRLIDESRTQENGFKAAEETKTQSSLFGGLTSNPLQQGFTSNILSEDNKPKVGLFGTTTTQGFGANLGGDNKSQTGLFGSSISKPITQETEVSQPETKPGLFGSQTPALQGFGENKPQTGIFGNLSQQPKPQEEIAAPAQITEQPKSTLFGGLTTSKPGLFGSQPPASQGFGFTQPTENKPSTGLFGSLPQQPKPQESIVAQPQVSEQPKSNLFGGLASTTPVLGLGSAATLEDNKPKTGLFGAPTQPSTGFGFSQATETKPQTGIFGNLSQQPKPQEETAVPAQTTEQPKSTLFGGLTTSKPGLFGSQTPAPQGFGFNQPTENKPSTGLFGSLPQQPKAQEPVIAQPQISEQPKPNLFGGLVQKPVTQEPAQETAPKLGLFGSSSSSFTPAAQKSEPQPTSTSIEDTNKPNPGLFGSLSQTVKPQGLGFGQTEGTQPKSGFISVMPQLPKAQEPVITQPQTSEQPKPNLFGGLGQKPLQQDTGAQKPALFGGITQVVTPSPQTQGFTMSQPAENKPSLGLFGASSQQPKPQESSVAQPKPAEQPKTNFFGSTTQTPGLFGANAQPSASTGLGFAQAGENKPQSGFFGSFSQKPAALTPSAEETKKESKPVQEEPKAPAVQDTGAPKSSIFSTLLHKTAQEEGLEPETKPEPEKKPLFGNLLSQKPAGTEAPPATGLFGQILGTKPAEPAKTGGLFSSTPAPATSSLFSGDHKSSSDKDNKPESESKPGLFAAGAKSGGLFSSGNATKPLFASLMTKPPTTFTSALSTQPVNPLNMFTKPPKGDDEGSEGEGDDGEDEEPVRTPSPEADLTKSKGNYQYQFDYDKIISKKVNKLKPGAKDMLLEGEVSLNKNKEGQVYFIIYRNKAKIAQYQGQLIPKVSKTEFLNPRQDALSVTAYSTDKGAEGEKPKMNKDVIKIMFGTPDDCNAFKKEVDKILS